MNTRTLLTVLAVVVVAFAATNCLAAAVDANKPGDANKPAEPNKVTIISASDFGTFADINKPADVNNPAEPNKTKLAAENGEKGKGYHHNRDPNQMEPNQPKDPNNKK